MPVIKSAKKKFRQDKKRTLINSAFDEALRAALKKAKKSPSQETVRLAFKATDKAAKHHIIHKNKASRIKSALSKLIAVKTPASSKTTVSKENKISTVKIKKSKKTLKTTKK